MTEPVELMLESVPLWIAGKVVVPSGRFGHVFNPANGRITKKVTFADASAIDAAVKAATTAFLPGATRRPYAGRA